MPITVDPTFVAPPPPEVLTSPDGVVTARVDEVNAGVALKADYTTAGTLPKQVRFYRGDGTLVRSGDPAYAPGGVAVAYDHEAAPGVGNVYYTAPVSVDSVEGAPSQAVAIGLPQFVDPARPEARTWIKAPANPSLSRMFRIPSFTQSDRATGANVVGIQGSQLPMVSRDVLGALAGQMVIRTDTEAEYDAMQLLLGETVLLFQPSATGGEKPMYFVATKVGGAGRIGDHSLGWWGRLWQVDFQACRRPATLGAPLMVPGLSYDVTDSKYATYGQQAAMVPSYLSLLGWDTAAAQEVLQSDVLDAGTAGGVPAESLDLGGA